MIGLIWSARYVILVVAVLSSLSWAYWSAVERGKAEQVAKQNEIVLRKIENATKADDTARSCSRDPACRLSDDGYKRD